MKLISLTTILFFCLFGYSCNRSQPKKEYTLPDTLADGRIIKLHESKTVSLIKLIANPEQFDGKKIRVIGYCHLEFEGNGLYLNKEDFDYSINKNSIWIEIPVKHPESDSSFSKFSNQYVLMEGTFDSHNHGHNDSGSGSIKDITPLELRTKINNK